MSVFDRMLEKYKEYLKKLDYPNIDRKSDNDVKYIFEKENRIFLLTWLLTKLVPNYNIRLEQAKRNNKLESTIANIMYDNGFCRLSEKDTIVLNGIDTDTEKQITIFNRIFTMLTLLQTENPDKENISSEEHDIKQVFTKLSKENLERIINYDVKLFSNYGSHDKMTDAQRQGKIASYKKEIEKLNIDIALKECDIEKGTPENTEPINEELIESLITKLNEVKTCFIDNFTDIGGFVQETETVSHSADFPKHIEESSKDLKNIVEVLEKKICVDKIISKDGLSQSQPAPSSDNNYSQYILKNYVISENIIKDLKSND